MSESNAVGFRDQAEQAAVAVKTPRTALLDDLKSRLVVAVQQLVRDSAAGIFVCEFERLRTEPLHVNNRDEAVRQDASD